MAASNLRNEVIGSAKTRDRGSPEGPIIGQTSAMDPLTNPNDAAGPLSAEELAALSGATMERVERLTGLGLLVPLPDGRFQAGDVHRVRLYDAFEASGVSLDALVAGASSGRIDFSGYHELHRDPGEPSDRTYGAFREATDAEVLASLFVAFGLAEPGPTARLTVEDERLLERWQGLVSAIDDRDLAVRVIRLVAENARRSSGAALDVYMEAAARLGPDAASVDMADYARLLEPWSRVGRELSGLAGWLMEQHLRRSIDAFSLETTEQLLAAERIVPARAVVPPGIAFVDLTGFTRVTRQLGDEVAAGMSLRLGELAREQAHAHGGRLVKLLGDGALLQLPDAAAAVSASMALIDALPAAGLGGGHAGVHRGPVIVREGDIFGGTVNLAARISDRAPDGATYVSAAVAADLADGPFDCRSVGAADLQGIGPVELFEVTRAT